MKNLNDFSDTTPPTLEASETLFLIKDDSLPGAEVIHFSDTPVYLSTMMGSIGFIIAAFGAINGPAVRLTDKNVSFIELLQSSRVPWEDHRARVVIECLLNINVRFVCY
jgi:hypothetical protein